MRLIFSSLALTFHCLSLFTVAAALPNGQSHTDDKVPYPQDWQIKDLFNGNDRFIKQVNAEYPGLLEQTGKKQQPPFMFVGCVDSRVSEGTIFDAPPGTLFTLRNIANQYRTNDNAGVSAVAYGVNHVEVSHVIVTGHYGCGGVSTAITNPAIEESITEWIQPIRDLFLASERPEIVALRNTIANNPNVTLTNDDPGFRALVEENVKCNVAKLAADLRNSPSERKTSLDVYGFVYDVDTGVVKDLQVTETVEYTH